MLRFVRPSVCLSVAFSDSSRLLDGDILASPFQTHSKGGITAGYTRIQMLLSGEGAERFAAPYDVLCCHLTM